MRAAAAAEVLQEPGKYEPRGEAYVEVGILLHEGEQGPPCGVGDLAEYHRKLEP